MSGLGSTDTGTDQLSPESSLYRVCTCSDAEPSPPAEPVIVQTQRPGVFLPLPAAATAAVASPFFGRIVTQYGWSR
eukprot:COSAG06_NODE_3231_length_5643_cov_6.529942_4_plen_76_part_00